MLLVRERVLHREDPAPGLPVEDEVVARSRPSAARTCSTSSTKRSSSHKRRLVGLVAAARAELVVVVVLDAGGGKVAVEGLEVLVRGPGPPWSSRTLQVGVVADPLRPDAEGAASASPTGISRAPPLRTSSRPVSSR